MKNRTKLQSLQSISTNYHDPSILKNQQSPMDNASSDQYPNTGVSSSLMAPSPMTQLPHVSRNNGSKKSYPFQDDLRFQGRLPSVIEQAYNSSRVYPYAVNSSTDQKVGKVHSGKNSGFSMKHGYFHETNPYGRRGNAP